MLPGEICHLPHTITHHTISHSIYIYQENPSKVPRLSRVNGECWDSHQFTLTVSHLQSVTSQGYYPRVSIYTLGREEDRILEEENLSLGIGGLKLTNSRSPWRIPLFTGNWMTSAWPRVSRSRNRTRYHVHLNIQRYLVQYLCRIHKTAYKLDIESVRHI